MRFSLPFAALLCLGFVGFLSKTAGAQTIPAVWQNTAHYEGGDLVTDYGNIYRCIKNVTTPYLDPSKSYGNWELYDVRNNTTLLIGFGQPFPSLDIAWNYCQNARIAKAAYL